MIPDRQGTYEQERLWILNTLEELKEDYKGLLAGAEVMREKLSKANFDLGQAHDRIREQKQEMDLRRRNMLKLATLATSVITALAELVKWLLLHR